MVNESNTIPPNPENFTKCGKPKAPPSWVVKRLKLCCIPKIPKAVLGKLHRSVQEEDPGENAETGTVKKSMKAAGLAGAGALIAPHIPCLVVGAASLLGLGGYVYNCHEHKGQDLQSLQNYETELGLERLHAVPIDFTDIPDDQEHLTDFMKDNPGFQKIIDWKQANEPESKIQVDFIRDSKGNELGVVCKDGKLCPCSDPLVYRTGSQGPEQK